MVQKADQDDESKTIKEPLLPDGTVVQTIDAVELASKQQVCGAAWAGGITGMLIAGPIGAILLGWGGVHLSLGEKEWWRCWRLLQKGGRFHASDRRCCKERMEGSSFEEQRR